MNNLSTLFRCYHPLSYQRHFVTPPPPFRIASNPTLVLVGLSPRSPTDRASRPCWWSRGTRDRPPKSGSQTCEGGFDGHLENQHEGVASAMRSRSGVSNSMAAGDTGGKVVAANPIHLSPYLAASACRLVWLDEPERYEISFFGAFADERVHFARALGQRTGFTEPTRRCLDSVTKSDETYGAGE